MKLTFLAGRGTDAYILASLGCVVTVLERNPVAHELLKDAFYRGIKVSRLQSFFFFLLLCSRTHQLIPPQAKLPAMANLTLIHADARDYLASLSEEERPEVVVRNHI
jgi:16S rRNA (guanine1516-N2)-methyltransferase